MNDYDEIVQGRIVDRSGRPVRGALVEVYDKDLLIDQHLGTATTGDDGRFRVDFLWSEFRDSPFEGRPDIFVRVRNPVTKKTTRSRVFEELTGELAEDDSEEVMDLGDIAVD